MCMYTCVWEVVDWSILTACQPVKDYFMPRGQRIVRSYLHFLCIWPIDGTRTDTTSPAQSGPGSNGNENVLYTPHISQTKFRHQMQSHIQEISFSGLFYPSAEWGRGYSQSILSPTRRMCMWSCVTVHECMSRDVCTSIFTHLRVSIYISIYIYIYIFVCVCVCVCVCVWRRYQWLISIYWNPLPRQCRLSSASESVMDGLCLANIDCWIYHKRCDWMRE